MSVTERKFLIHVRGNDVLQTQSDILVSNQLDNLKVNQESEFTLLVANLNEGSRVYKIESEHKY